MDSSHRQSTTQQSRERLRSSNDAMEPGRIGLLNKNATNIINGTIGVGQQVDELPIVNHKGQFRTPSSSSRSKKKPRKTVHKNHTTTSRPKGPLTFATSEDITQEYSSILGNVTNGNHVANKKRKVLLKTKLSLITRAKTDSRRRRVKSTKIDENDFEEGDRKMSPEELQQYVEENGKNSAAGTSDTISLNGVSPNDNAAIVTPIEDQTYSNRTNDAGDIASNENQFLVDGNNSPVGKRARSTRTNVDKVVSEGTGNTSTGDNLDVGSLIGRQPITKKAGSRHSSRKRKRNNSTATSTAAGNNNDSKEDGNEDGKEDGNEDSNEDGNIIGPFWSEMGIFLPQSERCQECTKDEDEQEEENILNAPEQKVPPLAELPTFLGIQAFKENLPKRMHRDRILEECQNKEQKEALEKLYNEIERDGPEFFDGNECLLRKLKIEPRPLTNEPGIYYGKHYGGGSKIGMSLFDNKERALQQHFTEACLLFPVNEAKELIGKIKGKNYIDDIIAKELAGHHFHEDQVDMLRNLIALQLVEGILGCAYKNSCKTYFERLFWVPKKEIRNTVRMDRLIECGKLAGGEFCPNSTVLTKEELDAIEFLSRVGPNEKIPQVYSWITVKCQNRETFGETPFMKNAQRDPPPDGKFLTNNLAMRLCGEMYGGFVNTVTISRASEKIDHCVSKLKPKLEEELPKLREARKNDGVFIIEQSKCDEIRDILKPITNKAEDKFDEYEEPEKQFHGKCSIRRLEEELFNNPLSPTMVMTQRRNIDAIESVDSNWLKNNFKTENAINWGLSMFLEARHHPGKLLVVQRSFYRIFCPHTSNEVRRLAAADFCFHQDLMVANGFLDYEQALKDRRLIETYLMHLLFGEKENKTSSTKQDKHTKNSYHFARNSVFSGEWFKPALAGIKATSDYLGVSEQVFIYLYNKLGSEDKSMTSEELMRILITAFGLMKGNSINQLAPYEPGACCWGPWRWDGSVPTSNVACGNQGKGGDEGYLMFNGVRGRGDQKWRGYMVCTNCYKKRPCQISGCTTSARGTTGFCIVHGGGKLCQISGCTTSARGSTNFCSAHGGGKRCQISGCKSGAEGSTNFCSAHGGGKRCQISGCKSGAVGTTGFCSAHGGGKRCQISGCKSGAVGSTKYCTAHGKWYTPEFAEMMKRSADAEDEDKNPLVTQYDVLIGKYSTHPGNEEFQKIVAGHCQKYQSTSKHKEKALIVDKILQMIQNNQGREGRFLKKVSKKWVKAEEEEARKKIKKALYKASSSSSSADTLAIT